MGHQTWPRQPFRKKHKILVIAPKIGDEPHPKLEWLGVRIVNPKDTNPSVDPKHDDAPKFTPERRPIIAGEVERADVLVSVGRIVRSFHATVRGSLEPIRMVSDVRMVWGALKRHVECDVEAQFARSGDEHIEILQRTQRRVHRFVSAAGVADGPRATRVAGFCGQRIISALARRLAYLVNRRQNTRHRIRGLR
jgi:hypothetical protein